MLGLLAGCASQSTTTPEHASSPVSAQPPLSISEQIERDIAKNRLTTPKGNNAMEKIVLLPKRDQQQHYKRQVARRYVQLAELELQRNNYIKASRYAVKAEKIGDNPRGLEQVRQRIQNYQEKSVVVPTPAQIAPPKPVMSLAGKALLDTIPMEQAEVRERKFELRYRIDLVIEKTVKQNALVELTSQNENDARWLSSLLRSRIRLSHPHFDLVIFSTIDPAQAPQFGLFSRAP